jgi:serine/threonine protein kinase
VGRDDSSDPLVGQLVDGRWRLIDRIGAGGFGVVYRAERIKLSKMVALKFLDERGMKSKEALARFEREARAISRVQHRHTVSILDFGVHEGRPYIVMEYLQGVSLAQEMGKSSMTPMRGVRIMGQMLEALRFAHQAGVVHRDLKPDNVMLVEMTGGRDFVKLLDFGLARIISLDEPTITMPNMVAGTPSYMSPEQARGKKTDHRTDIYSAGVILYGMCTGRKPFKSDDAGQILEMHKTMPPPSPRKVAPDKKISEALERVILKALEKDPDDRYLHAAGFLDALKATPEGGASIADEKPPRSRGRSFLVAATLIFLGAAGALAARPFVESQWPVMRGALDRFMHKPAPESPNPAPEPPKPVEVAKPAEAPPPSPAPAATPVPAVPPAPAPEATLQQAPPVAEETTKAEEKAKAEVKPKAEEKPPEPASEKPAVTEKPAGEPQSVQERVEALIEDDKLADAEKQLRAEEILHPKAAWTHLLLGEIYFRRLWRKDAEKEWTNAIQLEPSLKKDPRIGKRLCATLGKGWKGAGERFIISKIGSDSVAPLTECIRTTDDPERVRTAAHVIERAAGRSKLDRALVEKRLAELPKH